MASFQKSFGGLHGFDELRKYIKQGSEFCKDVSTLMAERSKLEASYAEGLYKIGNKLSKACANSLGTLADAWKAVGAEMEQESELHKNLAQALSDEISKPLKILVDNQSKARKPIESAVDKSLKNLADKRTEEARAKKGSFSSARDYEKIQDTVGDALSGKGKYSEKEVSRLKKKSRQSLDSVREADKVYVDCCQKAEQTRQEWENNVCKCSGDMQSLEEERMKQMQYYFDKYRNNISNLGPKLTQISDKIHEKGLSVDLQKDIRSIVEQRGTGEMTPEQILVDCYAEDKSFTMKPERRRAALQNHLLYIQQAIEREQHGKEGVEKLVGVYQTQPSFSNQESSAQLKDQMIGIICLLNLLEASHYKLSCAMADLDRSNKPTYRFSKWIEHTKDKQGLPLSVLRIPATQTADGGSGYSPQSIYVPSTDNATGSSSQRSSISTAARNSQYDSYDDEFDDDDDDEADIERFRALYTYTAQQHDELSLKEGDIINVFRKQDDGWWHGELYGKTGMFPSTYVEPIY